MSLDSTERTARAAEKLLVCIEARCPYAELRMSHRVHELLALRWIDPTIVLESLVRCVKTVGSNLPPELATGLLVTLQFVLTNNGRLPNASESKALESFYATSFGTRH